ncbi:MAG: Stealth CR1 domain-containing protein [Flavobacteriaceae bacterium]|nr:Stealth CR1 domain-containing protein [Flavobacteriaceae bacterium]
MENKQEKIDFVIAWVDGGDEEWQKDFAKYKNVGGDNRASRFRSWDNLQYLFRGIEKFTPWVNKIYFVTYGHLPKWLDTSHPKLVIVNHEDYLDKETLPLFNCNPLEINFHRIKGLSEKFVYFNDDTFMLKPVGTERFFKKGLPVNTAISSIMHQGEITHIIANDIAVINKYFDKYEVMKKHFWKWFTPKYGLPMVRSLLLLPWRTFTGFLNYHHPQPFLKRTYEEVWEKEPELLKKVSSIRIRSNEDVNQYLFKYWQFAKGDFYPASYSLSYKKSKYLEVYTKEDAEGCAEDIRSGKYEFFCPNDGLTEVSDEDYEYSKKIINEAFDSVLPEKSRFEL